MSRIAFAAFLLAGLSAAPPAQAADMSADAHEPSAARNAAIEAGEDCRGPRVEVARYREQVCQRGVSGYAACRWVQREHEVRIPAECVAKFTVEDARPATRGAFPPHPRS